MYAGYAQDVLHDQTKADEAISKAARIEEMYSMHSTVALNDRPFGEVLHHIITDEQDAAVSVSCYGRDSGEITAANVQAGSFVGLQRFELVGKAFSSLFPHPYSEWVAAQLAELQSSSACYMLNHSLVLPLLTAFGGIEPAVILVREHPPDEPGDAPSLVATMKAMTRTTELAVFSMQVRGLRCFARCDVVLTLLNCFAWPQEPA